MMLNLGISIDMGLNQKFQNYLIDCYKDYILSTYNFRTSFTKIVPKNFCHITKRKKKYLVGISMFNVLFGKMSLLYGT